MERDQASTVKIHLKRDIRKFQVSNINVALLLDAVDTSDIVGFTKVINSHLEQCRKRENHGFQQHSNKSPDAVSVTSKAQQARNSTSTPLSLPTFTANYASSDDGVNCSLLTQREMSFAPDDEIASEMVSQSMTLPKRSSTAECNNVNSMFLQSVTIPEFPSGLQDSKTISRPDLSSTSGVISNHHMQTEGVPLESIPSDKNASHILSPSVPELQSSSRYNSTKGSVSQNTALSELPSAPDSNSIAPESSESANRILPVVPVPMLPYSPRLPYHMVTQGTPLSGWPPLHTAGQNNPRRMLTQSVFRPSSASRDSSPYSSLTHSMPLSRCLSKPEDNSVLPCPQLSSTFCDNNDSRMPVPLISDLPHMTTAHGTPRSQNTGFDNRYLGHSSDSLRTPIAGTSSQLFSEVPLSPILDISSTGDSTCISGSVSSVYEFELNRSPEMTKIVSKHSLHVRNHHSVGGPFINPSRKTPNPENTKKSHTITPPGRIDAAVIAMNQSMESKYIGEGVVPLNHLFHPPLAMMVRTIDEVRCQSIQKAMIKERSYNVDGLPLTGVVTSEKRLPILTQIATQPVEVTETIDYTL